MLLVLDPDELTGFYGGKYAVSAEDDEIYLVTELGAIPRKGKYTLTSLDEESLTPIGADWIAPDGGLTAPAVPAVVGETTFEGRLAGFYEATTQINLIDSSASLIVAQDWRHPVTILGSKLKLLYEVQDISTLYADFIGTPATYGATVALQLDTAPYNTTLELLTNPNFIENINSWTATNNSALEWRPSTAIRVTRLAGSGYPQARQVITRLTVGRKYTISATIDLVSTGGVAVYIAATGIGSVSRTDAGALTLDFIATSTSATIEAGITNTQGSPGYYFEMGNISVKESTDTEMKGRGALAMTGTATAATYNTSTGQGTATRVDGSNFSYVVWTGLTNARLYAVDLENTGSASLSVRGADGSNLISIAAGERKIIKGIAAGGGVRVACDTNGTSIAFTVHSLTEVLGTPRYQSDSTKRAILGRHPAGGRRNILPSSYTQSSWNTIVATTPASVASGYMAADGVTPTWWIPAGATGYNQANHTIPANYSTWSWSVEVKSLSGTGTVDFTSNGIFGVDASNATFNFATGVFTGANKSTVTSLGNGWYRLTQVFQNNGTGTVFIMRTGVVSGSPGNVLYGPAQLESGGAPTAIQKVTSAYDVTETGILSVNYLVPDAVNDFFVTPALDLTHTDNIAVFTAMKKVNDTGVRFYVESSADASSNSGTFGIAAPHTAAPSFRFRSRGGTSVTNGALSNYIDYTAPKTVVLTGLSDISSDSQTMRINGGEVAASSEDQGTGNFTSQQLYFYSRGGTSFFFDGYDYGFALADSAPSDMQITKMEMYYNQFAATGTWVPDGASLHLDFINGRYYIDSQFKSFSSVVDLVRSGAVGYATDNSGLLVNYAANAPRFDYRYRKNQIVRSQTLDNTSAWTQTSSTVRADAAVAPDGTFTMDKLIASAATAVHYISQSTAKAAANITYTSSVFMKAAEYTKSELWIHDGAGNGYYILIDLSAGTVGAPASTGSGWSNATAGIINYGGGIYRVWMTLTSNTAANLQFCLHCSNSASHNGSTLGDGVSGLYTWGAQLEEGSNLTEYIPTAGTVVSLWSRAGLLIEGARTNLILNSSDLSTWALIGTPAPTADGTWWVLTDDAAGSFEGINETRTIANDSNAYTLTIEVKKTTGGTAPTLGLNYQLTGGTTVSKNIRLNTDIGVDYANYATVSDQGDRWLVTCVAQNNSTGNTSVSFSIYPAATAAGGGVDSASTTGSVRVRYPQIELGAFPTSYIPTTSVAVMRNADVASLLLASIAKWNNANEGAYVVEWDQFAVQTSPRVIGADAAAAPIASVSSNICVYDGAQQNIGTIRPKSPMKAVAAFDATNLYGAANGGVAGSFARNNTSPFSNPSVIRLGNNAGTGDFLNGHLRTITAYPVAKTGAVATALSIPSVY